MINRGGWIPWIDVMKGIGICLVVTGHIWGPAHNYIFWFHMPLFFFISGYLYKPDKSSINYFKKKARHLLVPYISFLILLSLPDYIKYFSHFFQQPSVELFWNIILITGKKVYGGGALTAWFAIFWFVTCLFFTQQLYNEIYTRIGQRKFILLTVILLAYVIAIFNSYFFRDLIFPWGINIVAISITFYYLGHTTSQYAFNKWMMFIPSVIVVLVAVILQYREILNLRFGMKAVNYGVPLISVILAVSCIFIVQELSKTVCSVEILKNIFSKLGVASMVIMYMHWPIQASLQNYPFLSNPFTRILLSLALSYLFYKLLNMFSITQSLFLGIQMPGKGTAAAD